jgi:SAM-dependent MidA family methyltransferase
LTQAAENIAAEIAARGPISFAEFMERALYCPVYGYYEREEDTIGRRGDYYTSVSVGSLFGELLAFQFAGWLEAEPPGDQARVQIIEAGAHRGELARDILAWLQARRPELFAGLEYWISEPSERRVQWQQETLRAFGTRVRWAKSFSEIANPACPPEAGHAGRAPSKAPAVFRIIFANELLDAMPVHRLGWDAQRQTWFEWGVGVQHGQFCWTQFTGEASWLRTSGSTLVPDPQLSAVLPDGYIVEVCPAAAEWWRTAAGFLQRGKLLTMDYGLTEDESLRPERTSGTLRGYHAHRASSDLLARPGEQDLTAHVNFTALRAAGESAGLQTEAFMTQAQFLTGIASKTWEGQDSPGGNSFGDWTPQRTRQFQTLTHPDHLGRAFRVLVQGRP